MIDITLPISNTLPVWPNAPDRRIDKQDWQMDGKLIENTTLTTGVHVSSQVAAPSHFFENSEPLEDLDLASLRGSVYVAHIIRIPTIDLSAPEEANICDDVERLLIRTDNLDCWAHSELRDDYVLLDALGSDRCVGRQMAFIGTDSLSILLPLTNGHV